MSNQDVIDEIAHNNSKLRKSTKINEAAGRTIAEVIDTMKKHPGTKMNDILRKMQGH